MRQEKVYRSILLLAFFLGLIFVLRFWVVDKSFSFVVCNSGGPFGIALSQDLFILVFFFVSFFLALQWQREASFQFEWPWIFIFTGGLGNAMERLFFGCVTDYVAVPFFPTFNLADVLLTVGTIFIIIRWSQNIAKNQ